MTNTDRMIKRYLIQGDRHYAAGRFELAKERFIWAWDLYIETIKTSSNEVSDNIIALLHFLQPKYFPKKKYGSDFNDKVRNMEEKHLRNSHDIWSND